MAWTAALDWLRDLGGPGLLAGTGLLMTGEGIIGLGFIVPGEAALLLASATIDSIGDFLALWAIAAAGALLGNVIGFEIGHRLGAPLRNTKIVHRHGADRWDRAAALIERRGTRAVFIGRLIPFVRSFVPAVAGAAGMPYRQFLPPIIAGAALSTALPPLFTVAVIAGANGSRWAIVGISTTAVTVLLLAMAKARQRAAASTDPYAGGE